MSANLDVAKDDTNGGPSKSSLNGGFRPTHTPGRSDNPMVNVEPPRREDLQPSYAQTLAGESDQGAHGWYGSMSKFGAFLLHKVNNSWHIRAVNTLGSCIGTMGAIPCCVICPNPYKPVSQGNVGLVTKFGRFYRAVDPGLVKINPLSERLIQVDVKIQIVGTFFCECKHFNRS
jgi:erythrocyte band 7 integral membrane protein